MKKIPSRFKLGGRTWRVKYVKSKKWFGRTDSTRCVIQISSTKNKTRSDRVHTFYHELLHAIASTMGWKRFNKDEVKIDGVASLLMQVLDSAR